MSAFTKEIRDFDTFLEAYQRKGGTWTEALSTFLAGCALSTADRNDLGAQLRARMLQRERAA